MNIVYISYIVFTAALSLFSKITTMWLEVRSLVIIPQHYAFPLLQSYRLFHS